ncbi:hypothetical protein Tco_0185333 [Tanacetum coccineum]
MEVDPTKNDEALEVNLDLIEEKREQAAIQEAKSKTKMEKYYNSKYYNRSNDASHAKDGGKLGPKWEGPYEVAESLGKGAYKHKDCKGNELPRTWNISYQATTRILHNVHCQELLDVAQEGFSIFIVNTEVSLSVLARSQGYFVGLFITLCELLWCFKQEYLTLVLMKFYSLILMALDSIGTFGFSNMRLEQTATYSILTISK